MLFAVLASCSSNDEPMIESEFNWSVVNQEEITCDVMHDGARYKIEIGCMPGSYWMGYLYYYNETISGGHLIEFKNYEKEDLDKLKKDIEINFSTLIYDFSF